MLREFLLYWRLADILQTERIAGWQTSQVAAHGLIQRERSAPEGVRYGTDGGRLSG
jgi:hypothetical protein